MTKLVWKPGTMLYPAPCALVSCGGGDFRSNIITIAWTGTACTNPPMATISVRPERFSYEIIRETGEFVINLPTADLARAVDLCGVKSGRDVDKWQLTSLTPREASTISAPLIDECPVNIECQVKTITPLGSHDLILAEVVAVDVTAEIVDAEGRLHLGEANLLSYVHGEYWSLGSPIGHFGFSIRKKTGSKVRSKRARTVNAR